MTIKSVNSVLFYSVLVALETILMRAIRTFELADMVDDWYDACNELAKARKIINTIERYDSQWTTIQHFPVAHRYSDQSGKFWAM